LCLKPFYSSDIFNSQKNRKIFYCEKIYVEDITGTILMKHINTMLKTNDNKWYFIKSYWFFEYSYVKLLIDEIKKNGLIYFYCKDKIFFEYQLYCNFLYKNRLKEFEDIGIIANKEYNFKKLLKYESLLGPNCHIEYICTVLNIDNVKYYCNLINELDDRIVRLHWMNDDIKDYIVQNTNVCIGTFHWD